jgi:hypothetical protein
LAVPNLSTIWKWSLQCWLLLFWASSELWSQCPSSLWFYQSLYLYFCPLSYIFCIRTYFTTDVLV